MQEDNFAPHFEIKGGISGELKRNSLDGADIDGHVISLQAIASGKCARKQSILVAKRNRYPVKFEFRVPKYGIAGHKLLSTVYEFVEFLEAVGVGKTQHGPLVVHLFKDLGEASTHSLGRTIGVP